MSFSVFQRAKHHFALLRSARQARKARRDLPDPELRARNWLSVHTFHGVVLDVRRQCEMTYADIEQNAMEDMHAEPIPGTQFRVGQVPTGFPRLASRSEQCKVVFCTLK